MVRGPAALMYGGNAIGGVVNVIDNRIPKAPVEGVGGALDTNATAGGDRSAAPAPCSRPATAASPSTPMPLPARPATSAFPASRAAPRCVPASPSPKARARPTAACPIPAPSRTAARWAAPIRADGFVGANYSAYRNRIRYPAESDVRLKMKQDRFATAGEARELSGATGGWLEAVKASFSHTEYEHKEIEHGATGTIFRNRGWDARVEARHGNIGPLARRGRRPVRPDPLLGAGRGSLRAQYRHRQRGPVRVRGTALAAGGDLKLDRAAGSTTAASDPVPTATSASATPAAASTPPARRPACSTS